MSPLSWIRWICSSFDRPTNSSLASNPISSVSKFFLKAKSPNSSLFHLFKSAFKAFNFYAKIKLGEPAKLYPFHHCWTLSTKPSIFNHIFSNLKTLRLRQTTPTSNKSRQWSKIKRGSTHWDTFSKCSSHSRETKAQSILDIKGRPKSLNQVKEAPSKGKSTKELLSIKSKNANIERLKDSQPSLSPRYLIILNHLLSTMPWATSHAPMITPPTK